MPLCGIHLSICGCGPVSVTNHLLDFHEIWYKSFFFYKKLSTKHNLCKNRLTDSHTLPKGVNEFLPYFPYFLDEIRYRISPLNAVSNFVIVSLMKISTAKATLC